LAVSAVVAERHVRRPGRVPVDELDAAVGQPARHQLVVPAPHEPPRLLRRERVLPRVVGAHDGALVAPHERVAAERAGGVDALADAAERLEDLRLAHEHPRLPLVLGRALAEDAGDLF
jgi:hypothetical protein